MPKELTPDELKKADYRAHYFGAEKQANPGTSFITYRNDLALSYGYPTWRDLPQEWKERALRLFNQGVADERKNQKGY